MADITLIAQNVNGDPFASGSTINITNNSTTTLTFIDVDYTLNDPLTGEYVSLDGGLTLLSYEYMGNGDVRGDPMQNASFIRIDMGDGTFESVALDMNADFDDLPDLQNGNTGLTLSNLNVTTTNWFPGFACFAFGTRIETIRGEVPVETLQAGDLVRTSDNGFQPLLYLARKKVPAMGRFAPVRFRKGALGNTRDLLVSQQHRMIVSGWQAELLCGQTEVFVPAKHLVNGGDVDLVYGGSVEYFHLLFAQHEVVFSEGIPTESYFPGGELSLEEQDARDECKSLFPELSDLELSDHKIARQVAFGFEARLMAA